MRPYKLVVISLSIFLAIIIFGFIFQTQILKVIIKNNVNLQEGNFVRNFYLKYPIPLHFRVYFFNVTNPAEAHKGQTPILQEVGPYCYNLYKERIDVVDNENEDSLTYTPFDQYFFNEECSGALKPDDQVTIIHPILVSMINLVATATPQFLTILNSSLAFLFKHSQTIYLTDTVRNILFDGMEIDCTSKNFSSIVVCSQIKTEVAGIIEEKPNIFRYSLLGPRNGSIPTRLTVLRGIANYSDLGRLIKINNISKSSIWPAEECNRYRGTDGWIFPPLSEDMQELWIHSTDLCRNIHADFVGDTVSHLIPVRQYYADFSAASEAEEQCYCPSSTSCLPRGVIDISKCAKVPIYITAPHFLRTEGNFNFIGQVHGLSPDTESHITKILFEEMWAIPMEAQIRLQFNLLLQKLDKVSLMHHVPEVLHPVLWVEQGIVLNGWILRLIQAVFVIWKLLEILKYLLLIISLSGFAYGLFKLFNRDKLKTDVQNSDYADKNDLFKL